MASTAHIAPPALMHNLKQNKVIHEEVATITIRTEEVPHVPSDQKVEVESLGRFTISEIPACRALNRVLLGLTNMHHLHQTSWLNPCKVWRRGKERADDGY